MIYVNAEPSPLTNTLNEMYETIYDIDEAYDEVTDNLGNYYDNIEDQSLGGYIYEIGKRSTGQQNCYPKYESPVQVTSSGTAWWGGTKVTIIGAIKNLDNAAAVNNGSGNVRFPCTAHGLFPGERITISGTINYDGTYDITESGTINPDDFSIQTGISFVAETFTGAETVYDELYGLHVIEGIEISEISDNGYYELIIWQGAIGSEVEIARVPFFKDATTIMDGTIPIKTDWLNPGRISISLLSSNAAANTVKVKLIYRESTGSGWA